MKSILLITALLLSCSYALKLTHSLENHNEKITVNDLDEFNKIYAERGPIIAFFSTASGSCKQCGDIAPTVDRLAEQYNNIPVLYIDS